MQKDDRLTISVALLGVVKPWASRESNRQESQVRHQIHFCQISTAISQLRNVRLIVS